VLGCVCVEAQGLMYDVYICVLPKQEKVVPDISPIPWFQQKVYLMCLLIQLSDIDTLVHFVILPNESKGMNNQCEKYSTVSVKSKLLHFTLYTILHGGRNNLYFRFKKEEIISIHS